MNLSICKNCEHRAHSTILEAHKYKEIFYTNLSDYNRNLPEPFIYEGETFFTFKNVFCDRFFLLEHKLNFNHNFSKTSLNNINNLSEKCLFMLHEFGLEQYFIFDTEKIQDSYYVANYDAKTQQFCVSGAGYFKYYLNKEILDSLAEGFTKFVEKVILNKDNCSFFLEQIVIGGENNENI